MELYEVGLEINSPHLPAVKRKSLAASVMRPGCMRSGAMRGTRPAAS